MHASADDILILVSGDSRREIESWTNAFLNAYSTWLNVNKLTLSVPECQFLLLKGSFCQCCCPHISIGSSVIQPIVAMRYLGIEIGKRLSFVQRTRHFRVKIIRVFERLQYFTRCDNEALRLVYSQVFIPIMERRFGLIL